MFVVKVPRSKFYQIVYFVDGKRKTLSTRKTTLSEAYKVMEEFRLSLSQTIEVVESPAPESLTISKFRDEYLEYARATKSRKYVESIESAFRQFIAFSGDVLLVKVDTRTIDKFVTVTFARTQRGAHQYCRTLKSAFNKAIVWNYLSDNPFSKVKLPKLPKSFPVFISETELQIILSNTPYDYLKDIFTVGFYTGLRLGELINMQWCWVDFSSVQINVKCTDNFITKCKKERIVPMCEMVHSILSNRYSFGEYEKNEFVFYRIKGRKLHQETISKQFKDAVRKTSLNERIHFHSLRHSFASLLVQKGVSLYIVRELLGHEDLVTTQIYSHLQKENLKDAVNLI